MIHPTALISPEATIADDVTIGPGAIIEAGAVIGRGCRILARAVITGEVTLGENNEVGIGAVLGATPQVIGFDQEIKSSLHIGNGNTFREYVTIHRGMSEGSSTVVGDHNFLMVGVHLGHNVSVANHVIIANSCLLAGHVEIDERAVLGGGAVFHQFIRIGKYAMVRGGSRMSKNIPPYVTAYESDLVSGLNVVGLRRAGMSSATRLELKKAFQLLYRSGLNITQALEAAALTTWSPEALHFFEFIGNSKKRGVCRSEKSSSSIIAPTSAED
ncbi:MAG: acyl-ACP--UDP-N-acetylglucosamine O-acyltransferase [Verrucomicrobiae bacterium]|nr:acyl-ACP--UDP-N-acetylglucosamine O-acyltransferase [Verrucomicrobiae bacterium]